MVDTALKGEETSLVDTALKGEETKKELILASRWKGRDRSNLPSKGRK
ncbi:MAG: hypothetical protein R6U96_12115 [Promethearchaeia archaeon]